MWAPIVDAHTLAVPHLVSHQLIMRVGRCYLTIIYNQEWATKEDYRINAENPIL
jgi:hypothetical protein